MTIKYWRKRAFSSGLGFTSDKEVFSPIMLIWHMNTGITGKMHFLQCNTVFL